jgi:hypothetical protein
MPFRYRPLPARPYAGPALAPAGSVGFPPVAR